MMQEDTDLSLLRINSTPYDDDYHSPSFFSSDETNPPLKCSSSVTEESDQAKRREISPKNQICMTSPLLFTSPETRSSFIHGRTRYASLTSPDLENHQTTPSASDTEKGQEEVEEEEEEDCGGGMRIERSGDGFVIRLKCRCRQALRVFFSDGHLYFKPL